MHYDEIMTESRARLLTVTVTALFVLATGLMLRIAYPNVALLTLLPGLIALVGWSRGGQAGPVSLVALAAMGSTSFGGILIQSYDIGFFRYLLAVAAAGIVFIVIEDLFQPSAPRGAD